MAPEPSGIETAWDKHPPAVSVPWLNSAEPLEAPQSA